MVRGDGTFVLQIREITSFLIITVVFNVFSLHLKFFFSILYPKLCNLINPRETLISFVICSP